MPLLLEYLGVIPASNETPLDQLGVNSPLNQLQAQSGGYFTIAFGAKAGDGDQLAVTIIDGQHFNPNLAAHTAFMRRCTLLFNEKLKQLKATDQKIIAGLLLVLISSTLSFLPLIGYFTWLGCGLVAYYMTQRAIEAEEYRQALTLLSAVCNWSLGESQEQRLAAAQAAEGGADLEMAPVEGEPTAAPLPLSRHPDIRTMVSALIPALTKAQAGHLIADDIEKEFLTEHDAYKTKATQGSYQNQNRLFPAAPDDEIARALRNANYEFTRCAYGLNKGGLPNILEALTVVLPDAWRAFQRGVHNLQQRWRAATAPAAQEQEIRVEPGK